jgi:hypothetical protein
MARVQEPRSEVNGNISDILHRADAHLHRRPEPSAPDGPNQLNSTIQRVSGASVAEIDGLIRELQSLRDYLMREGQRIQRELTEYTRLNHGALESTRIIAETLMKTRTGPDRAPRTQ